VSAETWSAALDGAEVVVRRETECVACCKRRKDRCGVCHGTRRWVLEYRLDREAAESFEASLSSALRAG
jgi:hypothetical protein